MTAEDALNYDEPEDWFYPVRESLEAALFRAHALEDCERVVLEDLEHNPLNPRTLYINWQLLIAIDDMDRVLVLRRRFMDGWKDADVELKLEDY